MAIYKLFNGYDPRFLANLDGTNLVAMPIIHEDLNTDIFKTSEFLTGVIPYINYSVVISSSRRFAYFSASNIDGLAFKKVPRKDYWRDDKRVDTAQWGQELYSAENSKFDRGHLTKREDVQWGETLAHALKAADSTFYFPNAVPQHKDLNRDVWRSLEDYILHTETTKKKLRICVMTGPVLSNSDPDFITPINGDYVQLPLHFWKVVYFLKDDGLLYRVGFLMSHLSLLRSADVISEVESISEQDALFLDFKKASTYQVNVEFIEQISNLKFASAIDSYEDTRPLELIYEEVDIDPDLESDSIEQELGFFIQNLTL
jgi:endonuclease G, mitochondrial